VDKLINAVGELVVLDSVVRQQNKMKAELEVHKTMEQMGKIIREVQDLSMSLRMVPVKPLIQKLQRICRDTSGDLGKSVDFVVKGEESEIDKTILDMISDPLVHLIRNGIDHGLEKPDDRTQAGKNVTGRLELSVGHEGGQLAFRIKDDGKGLDSQKIAAKAIEKKLIATADHLTESKIFELIFAPGFSTKSEVTEVSGRGVGMDVVKTCVNTLGGKIEIKSQVGMGTEFMISLPLTVAIIEGMVVDSGKNCFIVPFSQVSETLKIANEDLNKGNEAGAMLKLRGKIYPVFVMNDLLGGKKNEKLEGTGLVIKSGKYEFIMLVDNVVGQQQIVVKQLGAELSGFRRYVGSGVLGDGKPALILDLLQLADEETNKRRVA
ncbi:MAG: chemotaxis protein CheA, partial [Pseudobdellovibrionaceae bacterium]